MVPSEPDVSASDEILREVVVALVVVPFAVVKPPLNVWRSDQVFADARSDAGVLRQTLPTAKQPA